MDEDIDRLYGLPLAEFIPERTALVKRLRADKRRDEAAATAKLPKPTVAAWAANQVLRSQRADARELLAAGDALADADRTTLREAITRHRAVLGRLLAAASGLLDPDGRGLSPTTLEKVQQTLNAASLDPDLREEAETARLTREHVYSGLGLRAAPGEPAEPEKAKEKAAKAQPKPDKAAAKKAAAAEAAARKKAAARRRAAETKLAAAQAGLDAAQDAVAAARAELDALD
ncbi:MAG: hypothetical protein ACJ762_15950 [Solirubrobacteraceae bacterium]